MPAFENVAVWQSLLGWLRQAGARAAGRGDWLRRALAQGLDLREGRGRAFKRREGACRGV